MIFNFTIYIRLFKIFALFFICSILLISPVLSKELILTDSISRYSLSEYLHYYEDSSNSHTIQSISNPDFLPNFNINEMENPNFGFRDSTFWIKFSLKNTRTQSGIFYLEEAFAPMDLMEMYSLKDRVYSKISVGDSFPFNSKSIRHRNHIIPFQILPNENLEIYLKFKTKSVMNLRLSLHDASSISMETSTEQFFFGMFYGITLVLLFTNFFLFFSLREKLYIYYVTFTFSIGMYFLILNGFAFAFLWPNSSKWNDLSNPLFMTLTMLTGTRTSVHFLNLKLYSNSIKKFLDVFSIFTTLNFIVIFTLPYKYSFFFLYFLISPTLITIFIGAIICVYQKNPLAKFFLFGFSVFVICGIILTLNNLGIMNRFVSPELMQIATGLGTVILSLGLGHRYYLLKQQNLEMQSESLQVNAKLNRIQSELDISKKIHESLLPAKLPELQNARIFAKYIPSGEIGGDFYDFHYSDKTHLGIFIADVTGHGVPAALFASTVKFSFSRESNFMKEPSILMANINSALFEKIGNNYLSAAYLYLDLEHRKIVYASCGHPPLLIWKREEKEFVELKPKGRLIGIAPEIVLHDTVYKVEVGDKIIFSTDGLLECENAKGVQFGDFELEKFTLKNEDLIAKDFSNLLITELKNYSGNQKSFNDDVTFIVVDIL